MLDYPTLRHPAAKVGGDLTFLSWEDRVLSHGLIALQAHDPNSTVLYRKIRVKVLPD